MAKDKKRKDLVSDEQAVRKDLTRKYDHEFANEPLTETEKANNKKTKKRQ
ncbi:small acid-soluble spore protein O [Lentibacillus jeotgali]|nr:small acid-soluble spore protein O [Lentibacillus jeotgali]